MKLEDLKQDSVNARKHNPRNVNMIVDSIHELGCGRSILIDEDGVIIAGNATYEALVEAGITKVRVVEGNGDEIVAVQRVDLTKLEKTRLALYDNRASELSSWDTGVLETLAAVDNLFDNIFSNKELAVLLGDDYEPDIEEKSDGGHAEGNRVVVCPECQHKFKPQ
jgi:ParB-like chromosome segregation protein Spo0J